MEPTLSTAEAERLAVIRQVVERKKTVHAAATELGLGSRQIKRLCGAYRTDGAAVFASKRRGRPPNNIVSAETKATIVARYRAEYHGFGPRFIAEKLAERDGIHLSDETVRTILIASDLWRPKVRKRILHPMRERRARYGELVQSDGSPHAWFEDRGEKCALLLTIDDATSAIGSALFCEAETSEAYFRLFHQHFVEHGVPQAIYTDRHSIFRTADRARNDEPTQVGRALDELEVELICANSPQAKGRVERANRTLQDRLVKELRLRGIATMEAANAYLPEFIAEHNSRFAQGASSPENAHRFVADDRLREVLAHRYERTLSRRFTVQFENEVYLVRDPSGKRLWKNMRIGIIRRFDRSMRMEHENRELAFELLGRHERKPAIVGAKQLSGHLDRRASDPRKVRTPAPNHPWRKPFITPRLTPGA
jgi:transposase